MGGGTQGQANGMEERRAVIHLTQTPRVAMSLPPDLQRVPYRPSHGLGWYLSTGVIESMRPLREDTCKEDRFPKQRSIHTKGESVGSTLRKADTHVGRESSNGGFRP